MEKLTKGIASPAYYRDYKSAKAAKADFLAGKDFIYHSPWYEGLHSIRDYESGAKVEIRYNKMASLVIVTVP